MARRKEHEKEQVRRRHLEKNRAETFSRILENVPATFTAPQWRMLLRAFITCDPICCALVRLWRVMPDLPALEVS
jgi:hypothetical protein